MNVTGTGVGVALAVVVALGFLVLGPAVLTTPATVLPASATMSTSDDASALPAFDPSAPLPTDLTVNDQAVGTGAEAKTGDTVTVNYIGALPDGTVFDASQNHGQPFTFTLGQGSVIRGWDEGLVGMKEGGTRILIIPPAYGYGAQANGPIPANSTLIFQVELVSVQSGS